VRPIGQDIAPPPARVGGFFLALREEILRETDADPTIYLMHLREEDLEQYAMGTLPSTALRDFELHVLVCHPCQDRLVEIDVFVASTRAACAAVEGKERSPE
jgi:hypothetical protein